MVQHELLPEPLAPHDMMEGLQEGDLEAIFGAFDSHFDEPAVFSTDVGVGGKRKRGLSQSAMELLGKETSYVATQPASKGNPQPAQAVPQPQPTRAVPQQQQQPSVAPAQQGTKESESSSRVIRMERKKSREKKRRLEVNERFTKLMELLLAVEQGIGREGAKGDAEASEAANRVEILDRAISALRRLWAVNSSNERACGCLIVQAAKKPENDTHGLKAEPIPMEHAQGPGGALLDLSTPAQQHPLSGVVPMDGPAVARDPLPSAVVAPRPHGMGSPLKVLPNGWDEAKMADASLAHILAIQVRPCGDIHDWLCTIINQSSFAFFSHPCVSLLISFHLFANEC
ncbi:unnamed protein product [Chrysoparadoxa australica]